jgi:competence protein ComEA
MDRNPDWRAVEPAAPDGRAGSASPETAAGAGWRLVAIGALGLAAAAGMALALTLATPSTGVVLGPSPAPTDPAAAAGGSASPMAATAEILVDVGGAVARPGLYRLPVGSRVGDAIEAAGGYSPALDVELAGIRLNLAERLDDGAKIHVPRRGEQAVESTAPPVGGGGAPVNGLIEVNSADQATLETLPGIGPATAAKIIAARLEAPFASVDDLLARKVVGPATFEKIRDLVTVGP